MGQKYPKRANKKQWLKLFVLTFAVADAAGIYVAHKRLNAPVPGSMEGQLLALSDSSQASVPHVVSVIEPGAANVAVNDPSLRVNPELRLAPDHAVPAYIEAPAPKRLAKAELPSPAFGPDAHKPAGLALAAPAKPKAPIVLHAAPAPQTASVSYDKPTARLTSFVPVQRQVTSITQSHAVTHAVAATVHAVPSPKLARIAARQTAALAPVHLGAATVHAVPSPKIARMAASVVQTTLQTNVQTNGHHTSLHGVHHNTVQQQAPSFSAAFADMSANSAKADQSASLPSDWTPATSDFQHVATAPSAVDLPDSSAAPVADHATAPSAPAPSPELPAVSPAPDAAG